MDDARRDGRREIQAIVAEIAEHCASFFWNDVDIGLLHAGWRDRLQAIAAAPERDDLGLSVDMLDVDRLRSWAGLIEIHGADITHWGQVAFVVGKLRDIADRLDTAIRDIGTLRASVRPAPEWEGIETAPKDGTPIVAISRLGNVYGVTYEDGYWFAKNVGRSMSSDDMLGWIPMPVMRRFSGPPIDAAPQRTKERA